MIFRIFASTVIIGKRLWASSNNHKLHAVSSFHEYRPHITFKDIIISIYYGGGNKLAAN